MAGHVGGGVRRRTGQTIGKGGGTMAAETPTICLGPRRLGRRDRLRRRDPRPAAPGIPRHRLRQPASRSGWRLGVPGRVPAELDRPGRARGPLLRRQCHLRCRGRQRPGAGAGLLQRLDVRRLGSATPVRPLLIHASSPKDGLGSSRSVPYIDLRGSDSWLSRVCPWRGGRFGRCGRSAIRSRCATGSRLSSREDRSGSTRGWVPRRRGHGR